MANPLFSWLKDRRAGVLLHPTSIPSNQGIGVLGKESRAFIDTLAECAFSYWQLLPLGPTGFGDSPYQSFSAFAGNPYLIDLEPLLEFGLILPEEFVHLNSLPKDHVDFGRLYLLKWPLLRQAAKRFRQKGLAYLPNYGNYNAFKKENKSWLYPFAAFMALKDRHNGTPWYEWEDIIRSFKAFDKSEKDASLLDAIDDHQFYQYLFWGQWSMIKDYAHQKNIEIIGDLPIFVSLDSSDVWTHPEIFLLDEKGIPKVVAGVPPDYFSETGQLWGNPLYNWPNLKKSDYAWWIERFRFNLKLFDVVRIDHFRAFANYWEIPAGSETAVNGKWKNGPGIHFFKTLKKALPKAKLIAEDLGEIDDKVRMLLKESGLPGMLILQFAFDTDPENPYLPCNATQNSIIYPGTHDNDTSKGWYQHLSKPSKDQLRRYFRVNGDDIAWDFIRAAYASVSRIAIIPMQDLLSLGTEARFNCPSEALGNWQWRYNDEQLLQIKEAAPYLTELAKLFNRNHRNS